MQTNDYLAAIRTGIKNFVRENPQSNLSAETAQHILFGYIYKALDKSENQIEQEDDGLKGDWPELNLNSFDLLKGIH